MTRRFVDLKGGCRALRVRSTQGEGAEEMGECRKGSAENHARYFELYADGDVSDLDDGGEDEDGGHERTATEIRKKARDDAEGDGAGGVKPGVEAASGAEGISFDELLGADEGHYACG
jgi:hypothetical protein